MNIDSLVYYVALIEAEMESAGPIFDERPGGPKLGIFEAEPALAKTLKW